MSKRRMNPHLRRLVEAGFKTQTRRIDPQQSGYKNKQVLEPLTWRRETGDWVPSKMPWVFVAKTPGGWWAYTGHRANPVWSSPLFKDSTSALVYAEVANWGMS